MSLVFSQMDVAITQGESHKFGFWLYNPTFAIAWHILQGYQECFAWSHRPEQGITGPFAIRWYSRRPYFTMSFWSPNDESMKCLFQFCAILYSNNMWLVQRDDQSDSSHPTSLGTLFCGRLNACVISSETTFHFHHRWVGSIVVYGCELQCCKTFFKWTTFHHRWVVVIILHP